MAHPFGEEQEMKAASDEARRDWEKDARDVEVVADDAGQRVGQAVGRSLGEASRRLRNASERAVSAYGRSAESAGRAYRSVREYALEHPGTAVAMTFGAGVAVGVSLARRRAIQDYRRGIVPTIAVALAGAVLDVLSTRR